MFLTNYFEKTSMYSNAQAKPMEEDNDDDIQDNEEDADNNADEKNDDKDNEEDEDNKDDKEKDFFAKMLKITKYTSLPNLVRLG